MKSTLYAFLALILVAQAADTAAEKPIIKAYPFDSWQVPCRMARFALKGVARRETSY
jgi:hypothetical protein